MIDGRFGPRGLRDLWNGRGLDGLKRPEVFCRGQITAVNLRAGQSCTQTQPKAEKFAVRVFPKHKADATQAKGFGVFTPGRVHVGGLIVFIIHFLQPVGNVRPCVHLQFCDNLLQSHVRFGTQSLGDADFARTGFGGAKSQTARRYFAAKFVS